MTLVQIGPKLLTILLSMGINLKHISLGMHTAIRFVCPAINYEHAGINDVDLSDEVLENILRVNSLKRLEHFKCAQSSQLTMKVGNDILVLFLRECLIFPQSVSLLMSECTELRACLDLDYWDGVTRPEVETLTSQLRLSNVQLALTEEEPGDLQYKRGLSSSGNLIPLCTD